MLKYYGLLVKVTKFLGKLKVTILTYPAYIRTVSHRIALLPPLMRVMTPEHN